MNPANSNRLPDGWATVPLRGLTIESSTTVADRASDLTALSVSEYRGIVPRNDDAGQRTSEDVSKYLLVERNDLVMNAMWLDHGGLGVSEIEGYVSPAYRVFHFNPRILPRFAHYLLRSSHYINRYKYLCNGVRPNSQIVSTPDLNSLSVITPPPSEQRRIADYLDVETAQIDASIDAQRRLVALLQERRVGVIGDLVTHGVGRHDLVETPELSWSQESPRDWGLAPLNGIVRTRFSGKWGADRGEDEIDVPCVRVADFDRERRVVSSDVPTIRSIPRSSWIGKALRTNDLLLERSGGTAKNPVGTVVRYSGSSGAICSNFIEVIRLREGQDPQYWNYALRFAYENGFTFKFVNQTTGIQNLDVNGFYGAKFAVPPLTEQQQIVKALDSVTAKIDTLISRSERLIALLQERRSAVITAAVTGQIDVTRSEEAA